VVPIRARHIQDGGGRHFEKKTVKLPYLCNRLTDFDENWHDDADWPLQWDISLKFSIFPKPRWQGRHLEKSQKLRYHSIGLADLCEIWHDYAEWVS